jgi:hypothetical protein
MVIKEELEFSPNLSAVEILDISGKKDKIK